MTRATFAFLLIPIVCAESCARARALGDATDLPDPRVSLVGDRLSVSSGPVLRRLPPDQRYRFVPPDSLVAEIPDADKASVEEPPVAALRQRFATVVGSGRWVESDDSVQFEVTAFTTTRIKNTRRGLSRLEQELSTCGDRPTTTLVWCTDTPVHYTDSWYEAVNTYLVIRRRSDGAVRAWRVSRGIDDELLRMLRAGRSE